MSDTSEKLAELKSIAMKQLNDCGVDSLDHGRLDELVNRLKSMVDNFDATLVATSDTSELETVRRNFVEKTMGISDRDKGMAAINAVVDKMSGIHQKSRSAFYYLVQDELK
ncbi:DUF2853 family protein [Robiginitalea sp.]|jgi:hypothetical protein|uniref:DUF2853 family protein n=1 Tax=Robiginitalea sp. TaxID=1902411 RepID=UPI003C7316B6